MFVSELDEAEARAAIQAEWDGQNAGIKKQRPLQQSGTEALAQETTLPEPDEETLAADNPPPKKYSINQLLLGQLAKQRGYSVTNNISENKLRGVIGGASISSFNGTSIALGYASTFGYGGIEQAIVLFYKNADRSASEGLCFKTGLLLTNRHLYGNDSKTGMRKFAIKLEDINKIELGKITNDRPADHHLYVTYSYKIVINGTVFWILENTKECPIEIFVAFLKDYLGIE